MSDSDQRAIAQYAGPIARTAKRPMRPTLTIIEPTTTVHYERRVANHPPCGGLCCKHRSAPERDDDED